MADCEGRVVMTKDADFVDSHLLRGRPSKLLLVSAGNLGNVELEGLLFSLLPEIVVQFDSTDFVEVGRTGLIVRG